MNIGFHFVFLLGLILINSLASHYAVIMEAVVLNVLWLGSYIFVRRHVCRCARRVMAVSKDFQKLRLVYESEHDDAGILFSLNKISLAFSEKKDLREVLSKMVAEINAILKADVTFLQVLPDQKSAGCKVTGGHENFEPDEYIYEKISRGSSILINNLCKEHSEYERYPKLFAQGVTSFLVAPLKVSSAPIGLIGLFSKTPRDFTGAELRRLSTFATHGSLIVENASLLEETHRLSITDELTQLYNFRHFNEKIQDETKRAGRYNYNLSVLMCDIDYFKNYNDLNGHEAGNEALRKLAGIFKASIRDIDFVARYGGEEFVVLLVETSKKNAVLLAERIRKAVEKEEFFNQEKQPKGNFTITMGISSFPDDGKTAHEIIEAADKALYIGKAEGKNRVTTAA